jgi:hypothetical protein
MLMPGRWEGAYIAHILTYNAIMYAIRPNIAGGVGVAARRYNYSTQPQERMLPLRRKKETKYRNQCCGSATDPDPAFYLNADPDPNPGHQTNADHCETLPSQKAEFLYEKYTIRHKTCCFYNTRRKAFERG